MEEKHGTLALGLTAERVAEKCGVSGDPAYRSGPDAIDPERTLGRLDAFAGRLAAAAARRAPVLFGTGHPHRLLGFYAAILSVFGGCLLCWFALDIPPIAFVARIREVVPITDVFVGLIKAPVFGAIIAVAGCFQGMQVKGDAEQVGLKTTSAVVQAIFMVIVVDAFFAVFFEQIGWI